jgi:hypothetical protein
MCIVERMPCVLETSHSYVENVTLSSLLLRHVRDGPLLATMHTSSRVDTGVTTKSYCKIEYVGSAVMPICCAMDGAVFVSLSVVGVVVSSGINRA